LRPPRHWKTPARRRFVAACERARAVTQILIERRAELPCSAEDTDALGRLIARHRERPEELPASRLQDQAMTLMLAGNETTTIGLACGLRELADNPAVQRRWHEEIDAADLEGDDIDIDGLPYTRGIWRETLRLHPPAAGVGRVARTEVRLPGLTLPAKTLVVVPAVAMHRLPKWFVDPDAFVPQRWIDKPPWPRHAYLPFGAGPRVCIGSHLADLEAAIALALIGRRYWIEPAPGAEPLRFSISVTRRPKGGVPVKLRPRSS
jgi:cytochrome P450